MRTAPSWLPSFVRFCRVRGVALLLTLSILALLMILAMSFSFEAQTDSMLAGNEADIARARLLCQGGLDRAVGFLRREMAGNTYPASRFYWPDVTDPWTGRGYAASINADSTDGMDTAFYVAFNNIPFTDSSAPVHANTGWIAITTKSDGSQGAGTTLSDSAVGRLGYLIADLSGSLDVGAAIDSDVVTAGHPIREGDEVRTGLVANELDLSAWYGDLGRSFGVHDTPGAIGQLDVAFKDWMSFHHLMAGNPVVATDSATIAITRATLGPGLTADPEEYHYAVDSNNDGTNEIDQCLPRLDVTQLGVSITDSDLYDVFTGAASNAARDDSRYYCGWLRRFAFDTSSSAKYAGDVSADTSLKCSREMLRRAAQMTVNLSDYADPDNTTTCYRVTGASGAYALEVDKKAPPPPAITGVGEPWLFRIQGVEPTEFAVGEVIYRMTYERAGDDLNAYAEFQVELYNPFGAVGLTPGTQLDINYSYTFTDAGAGTVTQSDLVSFNAGDFGAVTAGACGTSAWKGNTRTHNKAFGNPAPASSSITPTEFRIVSFEINRGASIFDYGPESSLGGTNSAWLIKVPDAPAAQAFLDTERFYWFYRCVARDPLDNGRAYSSTGSPDPDVAGYLTWTWLEKAAAAAAPFDGSDIGVKDAGWGLDKAYGTYQVTNAPFTKVGELGRVHSPYAPNQSVRLWTQAADVDGSGSVTALDHNHDGYLMDLFKTGSRTQMRGKVNLNGGGPYYQQGEPLRTLFYGASPGSDYSAAAVMAYTWPAPGTTSPMQNIGDLSDVPNAFVLNAGGAAIPTTQDDVAEAQLGNMIELATVRRNAFAVIVCGQSVRDTGTNAAIPGVVRYAIISGTDHYCRVMAQQKLMALVERDAYTGKVWVRSVEYVQD